MSRIRFSRVLALVASGVLVVGCSTLPTSGSVSTEPAADSAGQAPYFVPPGPLPGADRASVVRGFLLATQANPPSTSVARSFLSESARSRWKPAGAIVYASSSIEASSDGVLARLSEANRIDRRGSWQAGQRAHAMDLDLDMVVEDGEWRIDNPPASLPIPVSYFRNAYLPYLLYFFDRSGTVLVPSRVYLPRGEQAASGLVRGLLAGPVPAQAGSTTTAFPDGVDLDLSVVVSEGGLAEVPLSGEVQRMSRAELYRAVVQLSATLRQIPGLVKIRVTVGGIPVPLLDGQTEIALGVGPEFDPVASPNGEIVAIVDGRVVVNDEVGTAPIGGPFGAEGFALRSIAASASKSLVAGVAQNGRRAYQAPTLGERSPKRVQTVLDDATSLLGPCYDRFGNLWLVDTTRSGAVVHVVSNGTPRIIDVPGISGKRIAAFSLTRDGASLIAGTEGSAGPTLLISGLVRSPQGRPVQALPARKVLLEGADGASIIDLAQDAATSVAVLTASSARGGRLLSVELDGSPGPAYVAGVPAVSGEVVGVLAGADSKRPALVVAADGQLLRPSMPLGEWVQTLTGVVDAAYPQ